MELDRSRGRYRFCFSPLRREVGTLCHSLLEGETTPTVTDTDPEAAPTRRARRHKAQRGTVAGIPLQKTKLQTTNVHVEFNKVTNRSILFSFTQPKIAGPPSEVVPPPSEGGVGGCSGCGDSSGTSQPLLDTRTRGTSENGDQ